MDNLNVLFYGKVCTQRLSVVCNIHITFCA